MRFKGNKADGIKEQFTSFIKYIETNTQEELDSARKLMFKQSKSLMGNRPPGTAAATARQNFASKQKPRLIVTSHTARKPVIKKQSSKSTNKSVNKDKMRELLQIPEQEEEKAKFKPVEPKHPPLPAECLKSPREISKVNEYQEELKKKEAAVELMK